MTKNLTMPKPDSPGFVPTLNSMGYMVETLDPYSSAFVDYAATHNPVLEIGAAYGPAIKKALKKGATVFANDLDARHLSILFDQTPENFRPQLKLVPGDVLKDLNFATESFFAILCSRVLHFMSGKNIRRALGLFYDWLKPNGKVFIVCETPYMKPYYEFVPVFEERLKSGDLWPGFITDHEKYNTKRVKDLPEIINWMHPEILERELKLAGFHIEKCDFFARPYFPVDTQGNGKESVGIIGIKKTISEAHTVNFST